MSGRIEKSRKTPSIKTEQRNTLLLTILTNSSTMPSCSACQSQGIQSCQVSPLDSSRCAECVRLNLSRCDVLGVSASQLRKIAAQHSKLESELEAAEEERRRMDARVERLRKQKKMWFEKMMRAVSRGIDSVEELERVEREEAEREERRLAELRPPSSDRLPADFVTSWDAVYPEVSLSPSLIADLGFVGVGPSVVDENSSTTVVRGQGVQ